MPLKLETVTVADEIETLEDRKRDLAGEQARLEYDTSAAQQVAQEGQQVDNFLEGLYWFRDEYPDCDELILSRLTYGEESLAYDLAEDMESSRAFNQAYLAVSTQQGPYLEHTAPAGANNKTETRQTIQTLGDGASSFVTWGVNRINDIDITGGDMGKSYQELVRERRIQRASTDESGENTAASPPSQADTPETT